MSGLKESQKKRVAGRQYYRCANEPKLKPKLNQRGLEGYKCPLWLSPIHKGSFDESGYEIDHIIEYSISNDNSDSNLQALCISCHRNKTKRFNSNLSTKQKFNTSPKTLPQTIKSTKSDIRQTKSTYHCSNCGRAGHNKRTCTLHSKSVYHCSNCGRGGHNKRTCTY